MYHELDYSIARIVGQQQHHHPNDIELKSLVFKYKYMSGVRIFYTSSFQYKIN